MEAGANARRVEEIVDASAQSLGGGQVQMRSGYASLVITIEAEHSSITRMNKVGHIGVNQRVEQELWRLAERVSYEPLTTEQVDTELARIATGTPRYPPWLTSAAVGLGCAAFGRLLGVDWHGTGPVFLAATLGQFIRHTVLTYGFNIFICTVLVSTVTSLLASVAARWAGSGTITTAIIASILLLVPGVPAVNALSDILEGRPTLGSARVVTIIMTLVFIAAGLWVGPVLLGLWH
jgi:uncharacterized membrane protein YjjP (DUF1212 family)